MTLTNRMPPLPAMRIRSQLAVALIALISAESSIAQSRCISISTAAELISAAPGLQAGDVLTLDPTFPYYVPSLLLAGRSGTAERWIIIRSADPTVRARIEGLPGSDPAVAIADCSYLRLEDLDITIQGGQGGGPNRAGVSFRPGTNSNHVVLDNCVIHDVTGHGVGSEAASLDSLSIIACEIVNCGRTGVDMGSIGSRQMTTATTVRDCLIQRTGLSGGDAHGIQIKPPSASCIIENNVFVDTATAQGAAITTYWVGTGGGEPRARWHQIRRNVILALSAPLPYEGIYVVNSAAVTDNVVFGARHGIGVSDYNRPGYVVDNLEIAHNTLYRAGESTNDQTGMRFSGATLFSPSCVIINNVAVASSSAAIAYHDFTNVLGSATFADNGAHGTTPGIGSGVIALGPPVGLFANPVGTVPGLDVYPRPGSSLLGAGVATLLTDADLNGVRRPSSGSTDLGAFRAIGATNPGWQFARSRKTSLAGLQPLVTQTSAAAGVNVQWTLTSRQPASSLYAVLVSATGPAAGPLPIAFDALSRLALDPGLAFAFAGYFGFLPMSGTVQPRLALPPFALVPACPLTLYHAAVVFAPGLQIAEVTNLARVVVQP